MTRPDIRLLSEGPGQDVWRIDYLETTHLRRLLHILIRKGAWFRVQPMSGGLWELRCGVLAVEVEEFRSIVGDG